MSNANVIINNWTVGLIKNMSLFKMGQYFPKPIKLNWIYLTIEANLKRATVVETSNLAAKLDFSSLKAQIDKVKIGKLKTVPVDLSKLSNAVDNDVVKKTLYDELVTKVNSIKASCTSGLVSKTRYCYDKNNLKKKDWRL